MNNKFENAIPENIEALKKQANDKTSYQNRLNAVDELGKYKCLQSKDILWRLMINDKVHSVQHRAFIKLQAFGEDVKLPRNKKGHLIKDINKILLKVKNKLNPNFSATEFNQKFQELYPEAFDVYKYEKKAGFDKWVENVLASSPKK